MKSSDSNFKCSKFDSFINSVFIKNIIKIRGSRKIFGNEEYAVKYLAGISDDEYDYSFDKKIKSPVSKHLVNKTQYLSFGDENSKKVVIYLHGGAFVRHITGLHVKMIDEMCQRSGANFVAPLYLTAPGYSWRESLDDIIEIYKMNADKNPEKQIYLMGDSAGGTIAISMLATLSERNIRFPCKLILFSPMVNMNLTNEKMLKDSLKDPMFGGTKGIEKCVESWANGTDLSSPYINPMSTDFNSLPETHIFTGTNDMLYHDCISFCNKGKKAGADISISVYENMYHVFPLYPLSTSAKVRNEAVELLK